MAEQCAFYYYDSSFWSSSYCCRLLQNKGRDYRVGQDWADQYCRRYNHEKCPYYNNRSDMSSGDSGCYLTSACVKTKGLPDDCRELQMLRSFRDSYLKNQPGGAAEIEQYYAIAPKLVDAINRQEKSKEIFESIYQNLVLPCVALIEQEKNEECYRLYKAYTKSLYEQFQMG